MVQSSEVLLPLIHRTILGTFAYLQTPNLVAGGPVNQLLPTRIVWCLMEYRQLGRSGLRTSVITLGTMGFGGTGFAEAVGTIDVDGARREIALGRDAGVNLIDTADMYSDGLAEEIVGKALGGDRDDVLLATKVRMPMGDGPNDAGLSRHHIIRGAEASLRRLNTDYIDLYQVHEWDGHTPLEETLGALDHLVQSGKVRYIGASNYAGWQLMKALGVSERHNYERFVSQQIYYSLQARDAEDDLVPVSIDKDLASWCGARLRVACCRASTAAVSMHPMGAGTWATGTSLPSTTRTSSTTRSTPWWRSAKRTKFRPHRWHWLTSSPSPR